MSSNLPAYSMSPPGDAYSAPYGPPRWSALAITAFVFSIIGFFGFTAILGIILGIAGIFATRGAQRRGRGLAVAALPISVVTGLVGGLLIIGTVSFWRMMDLAQTTEHVIAAQADASSATEKLLGQSTQSFQEKVGKEGLANWLGEVHRKHGTLIEADRTFTPNTMKAHGEQAIWHLPAKFSNGPAIIRVHFRQLSLTHPMVDDIDVDGLSAKPESAAPADK